MNDRWCVCGAPMIGHDAGCVHEEIQCIVNARLRSIAERLRVSADGPLVPEAEVYVRTVLAKAIEEGLEER